MTAAIYVLKAKSGPIKIGKANNVRQRISSMQVGSPDALDIIFSAETSGDAGEVELRAHAILAAGHVQGEWFNVTPDVAISAVIRAAREAGFELRRIAPREPKQRELFKYQKPLLSVRIEEDKMAELAKIAAKEGRTVSNLTQKIIDDFLAAQKKKR